MHISRREFIKATSTMLAALYTGQAPRLPYTAPRLSLPQAPTPPDVVVATKGTPAELVKAAVAALGGIGRFVQPGQTVVIKANFSWGNPPERATDTNPEVVATVVGLCRAAGARRVLVVDHVLNRDLTACLERTGLRRAVEAAGGEVLGLPESGQEGRYQETNVPKGQRLKRCRVIREVLEADVFINVPIAKDHSATRLTLSLKNLMGVVLDRGTFHSTDLDQCIADINTLVRSHLVIIDAFRILTTNGPGGWGKVETPWQVIASADPVAADAYAATLFKLTGADIGHIRRAKAAGLGEYDLSKLTVQLVTPGVTPSPQATPVISATPTPIPTPTGVRPSVPTARPSPTTPRLPTPTPLPPLPTPTLPGSWTGMATDNTVLASLLGLPGLAMLAALAWLLNRRLRQH